MGTGRDQDYTVYSNTVLHPNTLQGKLWDKTSKYFVCCGEILFQTRIYWYEFVSPFETYIKEQFQRIIAVPGYHFVCRELERGGSNGEEVQGPAWPRSDG